MSSSPGAKMLKKAMSLKTELRDKIIKRNPSSLTTSQSSGDGVFSKQHQYKTPMKKSSLTSDRLETGVVKVKQALLYATDVVQKKMLTMLPGTATVVLETVQELLQTLHYYYHTANSEEYTAQCADLYGATAELMRLSDAHVIHRDHALESEQILATIRSIQETITLLTSHCIEKTEGVPVVTPTSDRSSDASASFVEASVASNSESEASGSDSASPPPSKPPLPKDYELQLSKLSVSPSPQRETSPLPPPLPQKQGTRARSITCPENNNQQLEQRPVVSHISFDDADLNQNRTMVASPSWPGSRAHSRSREPSPMDILEKMRAEMRSDIGATLTTMRSSSSAQKMLVYGMDQRNVESESSQRSTSPCKEISIRKEQNMNQMLSEAAQAFTTNSGGQLSMMNNSSSSLTTSSSVQTYSFQQRIVKSGDNVEQSHSQTSSHVVTKMGRADVNASYVQSYLNDFAGKKDAYVFKVDVEGQDITEKKQSQVKVTAHDLTDNMGLGDAIEYGDNPPPLPLKKKHVDIYMLAFGGAPSMLDFAQSQPHFQDFYRERFQQQQSELALCNNADRIYDNAVTMEDDLYLEEPPPKPALLGPIDDNAILALDNPSTDEEVEQGETPDEKQKNDDNNEKTLDENRILICTEVWPHITRNEDDGIECVKGGSVDALLALAASASSREFLYQEAFLTTYLTFIHAGDLIDKLLRRYSHFSSCPQPSSKRFCRSTFSLLIRVVDEMGALIGDEVLDDLFYLVFCLISDGELILAKCLRKTVLNKCEMKQKLLEARRNIALLPSIQLTLRTTTLLDLKAHVIAEQMTLIDNELFQNIEISELLRYSREQREELSPNLTNFTEHFNRMSFWCRSRIMEKDDPKEREKYMVKFHKIMKHLRKLKNFHSYLALLSAVDSAPVRRLDWSKQIQESLTELSDIIDSSSSFRKYRNTLAETQPPCIPYIGLILQDLTFVHIGNPDKMENGEVNFSKRWQLFHILEGLRRYKKQCFDIKRDTNVIMFFNGFGDHLSEEVLWQLSEDYKPRKSSNKTNN